MAYQVLARKWRPSNFDQLVGQEHVSQSLIHALTHHRLHHAYLFTGTRGVGKTTVARILAKAMNCEQPQGANPCGQCPICMDFEQGRFMDLIEVDAASRTKVEDTRDLLDNAQYAPNQGRYKVYLIDEVHMLSGHSFNALLKTLEEPPPHVKFLLATTDPQKIPITVLSRCLQFNLKRLLPSQISHQLGFILDQEQIAAEPMALQLLADAADGSLRDALSLLDQAIVYGGGQVVQSAVSAMLGTVVQQPVNDLILYLAQHDAKSLLDKTAELAELTPNFGDILQRMVKLLHRLAVLQQLPDFIDSDFDPVVMQALMTALNPEDIQLFYQIGIMGLRDLPLAPDPQTGFEMTLLRMLAFRPQGISSAANNASPQPKSRPAQPSPTAVTQTATQSAPASTTAPQPVANQNEWQRIIQALGLSGRTRELANNCVLEHMDDNECRLLIDPSFQRIGNKAEDNLRAALQHHVGKPLKLVISNGPSQQLTPALEQQKAQLDKQQAAVDSIQTDPTVESINNRFGARILPGTIEPLS